MDLADDNVRAQVTRRLGQRYADRPVIFGPGILAAQTEPVGWVRELGGTALAVITARGAGPVPTEEECAVVHVAPPPTANVTEEMRALDHLARSLPPEVSAAIDSFDPDRRGGWHCSPFVTTDEPIDGRPVLSGRPTAYFALEDKMLADEIWAAAGVDRAPYAIVPTDPDALAAATRELAGPLGAVWSGDARDGFNGGGNYVRWVRDDHDQAEAVAWYLPRCDRVRVLPFLDGVPCSIHGLVLPTGTVAFRPVEISILRDQGARRFQYGGLSTYWDPPAVDRAAMRAAAMRVGEHLRAAYDYRGAFGIDGVLTADGFRPTELNSRASAGVTHVTSADRRFFAFLQDALVLGEDPGLSVADIETLLPLIDAQRSGRPIALCADLEIGGDAGFPVSWEDGRFVHADHDTGSTLVMADTPSGLFAKVDPCAALVPGVRLATLNVALYEFLDREYGSEFGPLTAPPDLR
jgi:hypothetical protein